MSSSAFEGVAEKRYFQFFRQVTVASTSLFVDSRFWDRLILQASDAERAIKHGVLAIAAFHNSITSGIERSTSQQHLAYAEKQYQVALREANALLIKASNKQIERVLMVCVLFILYEGMRGDFAASQAHMTSGRAIAAQSHQAGRWNNQREINEVLARLDIFALTFSDATAPYRFTLSDLLDTAPDLYPAPFTDIRHAHTSLVDLLRWLLVLGNHVIIGRHATDEEGLRFKAMLLKCAHRLSEWRRHWLLFVGQHQKSLPTIQISIVELWYSATSIISAVGFGGPETRYDTSIDEFTRIAQYSESVASELCATPEMTAFSLDFGYIVPTFFCAMRCRDPAVRRRALRVLELCPRREGLWESTGAAAVVQRWVQLEEEGLGDVTSAQQIPECRRIALLDAQVDYRASSATLRFTGSSDSGSTRCSRLEALKWSPPR